VSENRRRSKRVAYEIFTFTAVFALPVAFFLAFPSGATGFRAATPPPARRFSCSFVNLSQQEAQQAVAATRTSWTMDGGGAHRFKGRLHLGELPDEEPFAAPDVPVRASRFRRPGFRLPLLPPTLGAPPPARIGNEEKKQSGRAAFSREQMLVL
jgi:hypothetical protein